MVLIGKSAHLTLVLYRKISPPYSGPNRKISPPFSGPNRKISPPYYACMSRPIPMHVWAPAVHGVHCTIHPLSFYITLNGWKLHPFPSHPCTSIINPLAYTLYTVGTLGHIGCL